jgi:outer membrane protein
MRKYIIQLSFLFVLLSFGSMAQDILTLDGAIGEALEKNYGIKIAETQTALAENEIYKGAAGMSPIIDWNTNLGTNLNQVNQKFVDGRTINRLGYVLAPNTNLSLTWTLYNGGRMQAIFDRLVSQGQQSILQEKLIVQNTVSDVMQAYFDILRLEKSVEYLNTIIKYYEERLKITEERWQIGRGSKLDYLQSKTDLTTQVSELTMTINSFENSKVRLNQLLGAEPNRDFKTEDLENSNNYYNLETLINKAQSDNRELILINKSAEINLLNQKDAESFRKPRLTFNSGFGYSFNKNNAGFLSLNQNLGLSAGLSATWNIFNGQQTQRNIQATKINADLIKRQKEDLLNQILSEITTQYKQYETDKKLLELEIENKELAEENLTISLEKFRLGGSTILELNEAQRRFDQSLNRLVNAEYNVRFSELELLRLSGSLVE